MQESVELLRVKYIDGKICHDTSSVKFYQNIDKNKKTKNKQKEPFDKQNCRENPFKPENYYQNRNKQHQTQTQQASHVQRQPGNPNYHIQNQSSNSYM